MLAQRQTRVFKSQEGTNLKLGKRGRDADYKYYINKSTIFSAIQYAKNTIFLNLVAKECFVTITAVLDRQLLDRLKSMLAYQRRQPIHLRLVSQHIFDFSLDGNSIFQILKRLRTSKNASITLLLDKKRYLSAPQIIKTEIQKLEDVGVKVHAIRNLHAKIVTVENNQEKCVLVTSANLSNRAYYRAHEVGLYCHNDIHGIFDDIKKYITELIKSQKG